MPLLRKPACPNEMLDAYYRYLEDFKLYDSIGGGIGQPYSRPCGIPQGCPFSMMVTALILRPWIKLMRNRRTRPRVLADDMLIAAHGEEHLHAFKAALDETHYYPSRMCARLAPDKSVNFSSCQEGRDWLGDHTWKHTGKKIKVNMSARDLGAQLCLKQTWCNPTGRDRLRKATCTTRKAKKLRTHYNGKIKLIRANILPMALYACEAAELPDKELAQLRTAIVDTITNGSPHRTNDLAFVIADRGTWTPKSTPSLNEWSPYEE